MSNQENYGLLTYSYPGSDYINLGDHIQSLAAMRFLPRVDQYIDRESLNTYDGAPVKMIMNGWYMQNPSHFPPSPNIKPLYVSIHIHKKKMLSDATIMHLKKHAPIGCRDIHTLKLLREKDIPSYLSGCLTLTLNNPKPNISRGKSVIFVDAGQRGKNSIIEDPNSIDQKTLNKVNRRLSSYLPPKAIEDGVYLSHKFHKSELNEMERFNKAEEYLALYAQAPLVITSRIHVVLPCLAFGTPVIFINDVGKDSRFDGLIQLMNRIDATSFFMRPKIFTNKNKTVANLNKHLALIPPLNDLCRKFVEETA